MKVEPLRWRRTTSGDRPYEAETEFGKFWAFQCTEGEQTGWRVQLNKADGRVETYHQWHLLKSLFCAMQFANQIYRDKLEWKWK